MNHQSWASYCYHGSLLFWGAMWAYIVVLFTRPFPVDIWGVIACCVAAAAWMFLACRWRTELEAESTAELVEYLSDAMMFFNEEYIDCWNEQHAQDRAAHGAANDGRGA
jgi:hypothetical protein